MVLYGNKGHFREPERGAWFQILDPACIVYFRNHFRKPYTTNTSDTWLKGKNVYFSHKLAQKQQEMEKSGQQGESHAYSWQRGCWQATPPPTAPGKQVLGKSWVTSVVSPGGLQCTKCVVHRYPTILTLNCWQVLIIKVLLSSATSAVEAAIKIEAGSQS